MKNKKLKHTPGPWKVKEGAGGINIVVMPEKEKLGEGNKYATCGGMGNTEEREADLKLIAAAPEMLEALINIFKEPKKTTYIEDVENILKIIEKATGIKTEEFFGEKQ